MKGHGGGFFLEIATRSAHDVIQSQARSTEPRRFGNPTSALLLLRDLGIAVAQLDATDWKPDQKDMSQSRQDRAQGMREAHKAAAYTQWAAEIQASIDDPRPSIPDEQMMAGMDADLATLPSASRPRPCATPSVTRTKRDGQGLPPH